MPECDRYVQEAQSERVLTSLRRVLRLRRLFDILLAGTRAAETISAMFVWRAWFLVIPRILLCLGVGDRLFSMRLLHQEHSFLFQHRQRTKRLGVHGGTK
jgi:hypothetical protein